MIKKVLFILFWFAIIPAAVSRISTIITSETITDRPRAYIEARWGGSPVDYLVHCPVCTSHWIAAGFCFSILPECIKAIKSPWYVIAGLAIAIWAATVEVAIKFWKF